MVERIIEIIIYVVAELRTKRKLAEVDLKKLNKLGYTNAEISTAISWLSDRAEFGDVQTYSESMGNPNSFRVLHEVERDLFTKEAHGLLIQFSVLGLINSDQIERLIERGLYAGVKQIDASALKQYMAVALFNLPPTAYPGSRILLTASEAIN